MMVGAPGLGCCAWVAKRVESGVKELFMGEAFLHRQLLLVLVPIMALAVFGALGLRRDRFAVEQEARERVREASGRHADGFVAAWPRAFGEALAMADRHASNRAPVRLKLDPAFRLVRPVDYPQAPVPPAWRAVLPEAAQAALEAMRRAEGSGDREAVRSMALALAGMDGLPPVVGALAELAQLRSGALTDDRGAAMLGLAERGLEDQWVNEAGVPVAMTSVLWLAAHEPAVLRTPEGVAVLERLVREQPSILIGRVLAGLSDGPVGGGPMDRLRQEWAWSEDLRSMAGRVRSHIASSPMPFRPFWIGHAGGHWLVDCRVGRDGWAMELIERRVLEAAVEAAQGMIGNVGMPAGFRVGVEVSGEFLGAEGPVEGEVYARLERRLELEDPPVVLAVRFVSELREPGALFGAQVRQQRLFAGLLACVVGVAGLGLWQTRRAFLRQLALNEEKTNFVSAVSHELRSPLASVRLLAEAMAEGRAEDREKRREYAAFLVQETRRLGALVENVLDYSRMEQGRRSYEREVLDLTRLVQETARILDPVAAERGVGLRVEVGAGAEAIEFVGDASALQQALLNLVDNALKHAPARTVVEVQLKWTDGSEGRVRISVRDEGPGVPAEDHVRIFERFYRRGSELRRDTQGVGLGLAIVRHVVTGHGGQVWVESEPGNGAMFVMEFPMEGGRKAHE